MKKLIVINPHYQSDVKKFEEMINGGWNILHATPIPISITGPSTDSKRGEIAYVLVKQSRDQDTGPG